MLGERSSVRRLVVALVGLAVALGLSAGGAAQETRRARLEVQRGQGAETCATAETVASAIGARVGYEAVDDTSSIQIVVTFAARRRGYGALVSIRGLHDDAILHRELEGASCSDLSEAVALTIAIVLDPLAGTRPPRGDPPRDDPPRDDPAPVAATSEPPASPPIVTTAAPAPARGPLDDRSTATPRRAAQVRWRDRPVFAVRVGLDVAVGPMPGVAPGATLGLELGTDRWVVGIEGLATLTTSETDADGSSVRARLLGAGFLGCFRIRPLLGCAVFKVGAALGEGRGVDQPRSDSSLFAGAGARAQVELSLGSRIALFAFGELLGALTTTVLHLDGSERWRSSPVSFGIGAGARVDIY
ncbi:MAG: hypothetical protein IT379_42415 [Deltaproteobacteria bacterium]|nr:hypothetical protein [Deltaproteobacteria bacterium]